jgi:putative endonuclease
MDKQPAVYILANRRLGTLYIGVTSNLVGRIWQHREKLASGFSSQYGIDKLVWYEAAACMESAIAREKQLKKWNREWKIRLIEENNPNWIDLWPEITGSCERGFPLSRE